MFTIPKEQATPAYLIGTSIQHVLSFTKTQLDLSVMQDCNVVAVDIAKGLWLFSINPPKHEVVVYSFKTGVISVSNINHVFDFVQNQCLAWSEI